MSVNSSRDDPSLGERSVCNSFLIRKADRHVNARYDRALAGSGLRTTQFSILRALARSGPATLTGLAAVLGMDRTTLTANLKPLERDRLIETGSGADRRVRTVAITARGGAALAIAVPAWEAMQASFEEALGPDAALLRSLVDRVVQWEPDVEALRPDVG